MGYKRQDVEQTKQYAKKFVRYKDCLLYTSDAADE